VLSRRRCPDADLGMQAARHADRHHVNVVARQERIEVRHSGAAVPLGEPAGRTGTGIGNRDQPGIAEPGNGLCVSRRDDACPGDPESVHQRRLAQVRLYLAKPRPQDSEMLRQRAFR